MSLLIKNGFVVDPEQKTGRVCDIFIKVDAINRVGQAIKEKADQVIDAKEKIVMPGIVDMHVHLREPGREDKETVASGTRAGLRGGVTTVLAMPNTQPAIDSAQNVALLQRIIKNSAQSNVFIAGAITLKRLGEELVDIDALQKAGVAAFTDDGASVESDAIFTKALRLAKKHNLPLICHCEDVKLSRGGVINLGIVSTILGLRGVSKASEYRRVERDIKLAEKENGRVHIAHVSCKESVEIIATAKKKKIAVTAETAPHYFSLDETLLTDYNTNMKINPPLRTKADIEAIKQGLRDGVIDVIASDHAPHTENEKDIEFDRAAFGTIGLETMLSVCITELIEPGVLDWVSLAAKLSLNPARIIGAGRGTIGEGSIADLIIVDPLKEWVVSEETICSQSKNSAFLGKKLKGAVECAVLAGKVAFKR